MEKILQNFDEKIILLATTEHFLEMRKSLQQRMEGESFSKLIEKNNEQSKIISERLLEKMFESFMDKGQTDDNFYISSLVKEKQLILQSQISVYKEESKGEYKYPLLCKFIMENTFNFFDQIID